MVKEEKDTTTAAQNVEQTLTKFEQWFEKKRKVIIWTVVIIIAVAVGYMAFKTFYIDKRTDLAAGQMFEAERAFENQEWQRALDGDGNSLGFLEIINSYGMTSQANLAYYYAGMCYLNLNDYDNAINYLSKHSGGDVMTSALALGAIGDANAQKGQNSQAISFYQKAANDYKNDFTSPLFLLRAAILQEQIGDIAGSLKTIEIIKSQYPESNEGSEADKYINRLKAQQK